MIKKVRVMTRPKANTLDPQGVVVKGELERGLGIKYLKKVNLKTFIYIQRQVMMGYLLVLHFILIIIF